MKSPHGYISLDDLAPKEIKLSLKTIVSTENTDYNNIRAIQCNSCMALLF